MPIIVVNHGESGSSTSIGGETRVECLEKAIEWLDGDYYFLKEE